MGSISKYLILGVLFLAIASAGCTGGSSEPVASAPETSYPSTTTSAPPSMTSSTQKIDAVILPSELSFTLKKSDNKDDWTEYKALKIRNIGNIETDFCVMRPSIDNSLVPQYGLGSVEPSNIQLPSNTGEEGICGRLSSGETAEFWLFSSLNVPIEGTPSETFYSEGAVVASNYERTMYEEFKFTLKTTVVD